MEIVIKIDEERYNKIKRCADNYLAGELERAIKYGIPLQKGHGDLIDKNILLDKLEKTVNSVDDTNRHLLSWDRAVAHVHLSKSIIEVDTTESKDKQEDAADVVERSEYIESQKEVLRLGDLFHKVNQNAMKHEEMYMELRSKIDNAIEEIKQEIQNGTIKIANGNEKLFNILKAIRR